MFCYPGAMVGLYEPTEVEKNECHRGIACYFGICSECTEGIKKEAQFNEKGTESSTINPNMWDDTGFTNENNC